MLTFFTLVALLLLGAGPAGSYLGLFHPMLGAGLSAAGLLLLALLFFTAFVKFLRFGAGGTSWLAFFFGLGALAALGGLGYLGFLNPINDITTDVKNPPVFRHPVFPFRVEKGEQYLDRSLQLNREYQPSFAATQVQTYPGFEGLDVKAPPAEVYSAALALIKTDLAAWKLVLNEQKTFHAEFEVESLVFRFVDDVVLEVHGDTHHAYDARIELRSRSRVGKSDFGANIMRLRDLKVRLALALRPLEEKLAAKRTQWEKEAAESVKTPPAPGAAPAPSAPNAPAPAPSAPPEAAKAPPSSGGKK